MQMKKIGLMLSEIPFSNMPVLLKNAGLDYFILDYEHGGFDYADMSKIIVNARLCGLTVIVRLPNNQRKDIIKLMDMGANGLLLPMTNTAADIACVVDYAKYRPIGKRGLSTMRAHTFYAPPPIVDYMREANAQTKVFAQIETAMGVDNIDEILSVEGVDGIFVGPNDLSDDYGCIAEKTAPQILQAIARVGEATEKAGKTAGIITGNAAYIEKSRESGFLYYCKGSELNAIAEYCKKIVAELKV